MGARHPHKAPGDVRALLVSHKTIQHLCNTRPHTTCVTQEPKKQPNCHPLLYPILYNNKHHISRNIIYNIIYACTTHTIHGRHHICEHKCRTFCNNKCRLLLSVWPCVGLPSSTATLNSMPCVTSCVALV